MKINSAPYLIKEGFRNLWVNRLMSFASIGVLCVCLLLISNATLLSMNITEMIKQIGSGNMITIYLNEDTTDEEIEAFGSDLTKLNNVDNVEFVSSEAALAHWKEVLADYPDLLDGIDPHYLLASYSVTIKDIGKIEETRYQIGIMPHIEKIVEYGDLAKQLRNLQDMVTAALAAIVVILLIVSIFIIVNTIKIAMYTRRKEVAIMKIVGGTDWFIRWPFIVEGFLIGIISGAAAFFIQWYIYHFLSARITDNVDFIKPIAFSGLAQPLALLLCVAGAVIGMFGSTMSIRKYLKV